MAQAQFTFASMIHRGFLADANASLEVKVTVAGKEPIVQPVPMMTSGDVIGIPSRQVIRTTPVNGVLDAEPNYLAAIEFDAPDLPWMFSRKPATGPVLPWITLAVIDVTDRPDPLSATPVGTQLKIEASELPDPEHSWMWAHGQLLDADTVPGDPARSLSRLVGARKLEPGRRYLACVVPVFRAAAIAGTGVDPGDARTSMDLAWNTNDADVVLPVYHFWRFGTGASGDFESLVRRLRGVPLPPGLGARELVLDHPLSGLPASQPEASVELHVALRPPESAVAEIEPLVGGNYLDVLKSRLVDAGYDIKLLGDDDAPGPMVGPPVHGQLAVGETARSAVLDTLAPPWVREANLDPRLRTAAGLGAEVVRRNQDRYVEDAWRQVGEVLAANSLRRRAEFSLAASLTLHRRWLSKIDAGDLITATSPVHSRVHLEQGLTITGRLRRSPLPPAISSVEYRRLTRARGRLGAATAWHAAVSPKVLASRSAEAQPLKLAAKLDSIETIEAPSQVWGAADASLILKRLVPDLDTAVMTEAEAAARLDSLSQIHPISFASASEVAARADAIEPAHVLSAAGMLPVAAVAGTPEVAPAAEESAAVAAARAEATPFAARAALMPATDLLLEMLADQPDLVVRRPGGVAVNRRNVSAMARNSRAASTFTRSVFDELVAGTFTEPPLAVHDFSIPAPVKTRLRREMVDVATGIIDRQIVESDALSPPETRLAGGYESIRKSIVAALDPRATMKQLVNSRISAISAEQAESLDDIMAAPDLSEPTYKALAEISHDWLLPGIDTLPSDTTTLVESNRTFISAFLVGMNHELARELLWREYPTDQRGTYSRQFWTHRNSGDPADQFDLKHKLHQAADLTLEQLGLGPGDAASPLVLVVKGELVRRYPGVLVTAAKTKVTGGSRHLDPSTELQPSFTARLEPDVMLVGFNSLSAGEVRSLDGDDNSAWWFFFAEHFTEPRFGFDVAPDGIVPAFADWNDASWGNVAVGAAGRLGPDSFPAAQIPKTRPGAGPSRLYDWHGTSSHIAWILLQYPFRRGMRAARLLPKTGGA
jgi:hypothetical protein